MTTERVSNTAGGTTADRPFGGSSTPPPASEGLLPKKKGHRVRNLIAAVTTVAGIGTAAFVVNQNINNGNQNNPEPSHPAGIVEPSNSPVPSLITPGESIVIPSPKATPEPTKEALTPHEQLMQNLNDFLSGKTKLPKDRFYGNSTDKKPARLNVLDTQMPFNQEYVDVGYQGYLIGEEVVGGHLIAYMGEEDKEKGRFYFPVALGRVNTNDIVYIQERGIILYNSPVAKDPVHYSPSQMQTELARYNGDIVYFYVDILNTAYQDPSNPPVYWRPKAEMEAEKAAAKAIIDWTKNTVNTGFQNVPMNDLVRGIVNQPVKEFSASAVPVCFGIVPYPQN